MNMFFLLDWVGVRPLLECVKMSFSIEKCQRKWKKEAKKQSRNKSFFWACKVFIYMDIKKSIGIVELDKGKAKMYNLGMENKMKNKMTGANHLSTEASKMTDLLTSQERELLVALENQGFDKIFQDITSWTWRMYPYGIKEAVHKSGKLKARLFENIMSGDTWVTFTPIFGAKI